MKNKKAFTLVELLIVVAIIGVLAGLLFPAITRVMSVGPKMTSSNNGKNIALAWMGYGKSISKTTAHAWAAVLAEREGLNVADIWILDSDPKVQEKISEEEVAKPLVVADSFGDAWQLNPEFESFPLSWSIANRTSTGGNRTTPLIWTRGLEASGSWSLEEGVFEDTGGHIVFTDGSVKWYESLKDENTQQGLLTMFNSTQRTSNIFETIKGGASNVLNP